MINNSFSQFFFFSIMPNISLELIPRGLWLLALVWLSDIKSYRSVFSLKYFCGQLKKSFSPLALPTGVQWNLHFHSVRSQILQLGLQITGVVWTSEGPDHEVPQIWLGGRGELQLYVRLWDWSGGCRTGTKTRGLRQEYLYQVKVS